jgi:hypothetical protein
MHLAQKTGTAVVRKSDYPSLKLLASTDDEVNPYPVYEDVGDDGETIRVGRYALPDWKFTSPSWPGLRSQIQLRPGQVNTYAATIAGLKKHGGVFLNEPAGGGKTVMSLLARCDVGALRTLILVDQSNLLEQWVHRIHEFISLKTEVGIFGNRQNYLDVKKSSRTKGPIVHLKTIEEVNKHKGFVVATVQGQLRRKEEKVKTDMLIVDEVHVMAAQEFLKTVFTIEFTYSIGLSANATRPDGLEWVFQSLIGKHKVVGAGGERTKATVIIDQVVVTEVKTTPNYYSYFRCALYKKVTSEASCVETCAYGKDYPNCSGVKKDERTGRRTNTHQKGKAAVAMRLTHLYSDDAYIGAILRWAREGLNRRRKAFIFVALVPAVKALGEILTEEFGEERVGIYTESMAGEVAVRALEKDLTITTDKKAQKGLDEATKDFLIYALPGGDLNQLRGRIERKKTTTPVLIDLRAINVREWANKYKERDVDYARNRYKVVRAPATRYVPTSPVHRKELSR